MNTFLLVIGRYSRATTRAYRRLSTINNKNVNHNGQSYLHHIGKQSLVYRSVGEELKRASIDYGSTEAIVSCHESKRITFQSLINKVDRVAAGLLKLGLRKSDCVGLWGPNSIQWYITMLGAARAGLTSVCINPAFQGPEIAYCLSKANINAVVSSLADKTQNFYDILCSICPELCSSQKGLIKSAKFPHLKALVIDTDRPLKGVISFNELLDSCSLEEVAKISKLQNEILPDATCNVQFTSGSTGQPKAALLSHFNFVNNGIQIGARFGLAQQRICVQVPLFHAFGVVISIMGAICHGATLVLPSARFDPEASIQAVINEKCTVIYGTPTMYVDVVKTQKEKAQQLESLQMVVTGGALCSPQLFQDIQNVLQVNDVRTVYGLTECTASVFQSCNNETVEQVLHTVGYLQEHLEVKVVNTDGNIVPFGQPGELCVRGYSNMLGYLDDEAKTKETIGIDRWLRTGDQFILQSDGYGRIVGRLKEMIIRGGENIYPKEIEDFLVTHPNIIEAYVIGVPDERLGEDICAFIRLQNDSVNLTQSDLKEYCKGKLAYFKVPRYVIQIKDFPKTTSGKIQKFKLLEHYKKSGNS